MMSANAPWAARPTSRRPLMKKCGVPLAWKSSAVSASAAISARVRVLRDRGLHLVGLRARASRRASTSARRRSGRARPSSMRVVHRPERGVALLGAHLERRLGRGLGAEMERQRLVLEDEAQLVAVVRVRARAASPRRARRRGTGSRRTRRSSPRRLAGPRAGLVADGHLEHRLACPRARRRLRGSGGCAARFSFESTA